MMFFFDSKGFRFHLSLSLFNSNEFAHLTHIYMFSFLIWLGIAICITQSATMSGLNISLFSLSRLRLEVAAEGGNKYAAKILELRRDSNFTLATILWGNVSVNVLLTLLADSVLLGVSSFIFSTVVITFVGEIFPQAYFTRNALRIGALLSPILKVYKVIFWPVAKPVGILLDKTVGLEPIPWFREDELMQVLKYQAKTAQTEIGKIEARGAVNFLKLDDVRLREEGELIDPLSIIELPFENDLPVFPEITSSSKNEFLKTLAQSQKKWTIVIDNESRAPKLVIDAPDFISNALFHKETFNWKAYCHHPLIFEDFDLPLAMVLDRFKVNAKFSGDDVIDEDLILLWTDEEKRIITGSDILGRLMRKIAIEV
jgi:metal transporter CNNM